MSKPRFLGATLWLFVSFWPGVRAMAETEPTPSAGAPSAPEVRVPDDSLPPAPPVILTEVSPPPEVPLNAGESPSAYEAQIKTPMAQIGGLLEGRLVAYLDEKKIMGLIGDLEDLTKTLGLDSPGTAKEFENLRQRVREASAKKAELRLEELRKLDSLGSFGSAPQIVKEIQESMVFSQKSSQDLGTSEEELESYLAKYELEQLFALARPQAKLSTSALAEARQRVFKAFESHYLLAKKPLSFYGVNPFIVQAWMGSDFYFSDLPHDRVRCELKQTVQVSPGDEYFQYLTLKNKASSLRPDVSYEVIGLSFFPEVIPLQIEKVADGKIKEENTYSHGTEFLLRTVDGTVQVPENWFSLGDRMRVLFRHCPLPQEESPKD